MEVWALLMFAVLFALLLIGFPVAFTLGAIALLFGSVFQGMDFFDLLPMRIWGVMTNFTLLAVPLFVFMGVILEKSGLAEDLLATMGRLFGQLRGGLAISVVMVGALLAATTGVVGASVVTMAVIALPAMLRHGYAPSLASGTIAASGTLGQIIPPSIILILLGDVIGVPVGELFIGAIIPGLLLIVAYIGYIAYVAWRHPHLAPAVKSDESDSVALWQSVCRSLLPPLLLIIAVLGSIFMGIASPTESAAVGALGALLLALLNRRLTWANLQDAMQKTTRLTSMVFLIFIGATAFGMVFVVMGGDKLILDLFSGLPGGKWTFLLFSMLLIFVLGFFLDFIEICFIVVPVLAPVALVLGLDPLWFALLIAMNLQTSFLTPPFGFSLFYLKASAPPELKLQSIYRGIVPFVAIQILMLAVLIAFPQISLWLPGLMQN
ncbi:TRAP transporter, DctM subunit [Methylophaga frappieri]|uniref:TRAP transporter large permease protein n=1 Tax=Methylophaga frappieri (strain ATCC BAA-2434 / DSM 25690 / JAM7) TaxID=754477 RepID=I1YHC0_METFJ|nr:TRAP transporter large permease subunit [Methylophaga frappieri]AFJ02313.1 TRAP transporter, DctM subunit [Methylophaga frappieri]